jgi:hypothetical protein
LRRPVVWSPKQVHNERRISVQVLEKVHRVVLSQGYPTRKRSILLWYERYEAIDCQWAKGTESLERTMQVASKVLNVQRVHSCAKVLEYSNLPISSVGLVEQVLLPEGVESILESRAYAMLCSISNRSITVRLSF